MIRVRERLPRDLTWLVGLVLVWATWLFVRDRRLGVDSHAYWLAWHGHMYGRAPDSLDAFLYSPAFAQVTWALTRLPWWAFGWLWAVASVLAFVHLLRPLGWSWALPLLLCSVPEIATGNVFWLFALVAAYGLRHPGLWAFPALTKVTPAVACVWFLVRGEWRRLGWAVGTTLVVTAASWAVSPSLWHAWLHMLFEQGRTPSSLGSDLVPGLWVRLPLALALIIWTAATDRRWGLPAAMVLATPVFGVAALTVLAALPRLYADRGVETQPDDAHDPARPRRSARRPKRALTRAGWSGGTA